ncbi:MAG: formate dehydrogenase accessory sulfurtransferase FdhD [Chloroflexi bacterium]|nr:formate dehydrogenase accessory sulfurtransferase FdhD [Chloroflexota bacterium]
MPPTPTQSTSDPLAEGAAPALYWALERGTAAKMPGHVIAEAHLTIYVDGQELATLACSPRDQAALAVGFLFNEGLLQAWEDVRLLRLNTPGTVVDVFLRFPLDGAPRRITLTSGCGGGITFQDLLADLPPLQTPFTTTPTALFERMRDMQTAAHLYRNVGGVHSALLGTPERSVFSVEDIGRHNAIDKLAGKALQNGIDPRDHMLLTSGRISAEMVHKARRMGVPLIASRTSPTSTAVLQAAAWHICVVGYLRGHGLRVYTHPQRLGLEPFGGNTGK